MSEQRLVEWAAAATGDEVVAAGRFFPKGSSSGSTAAALAGATATGAANELLGVEADGEGTAEIEGWPAHGFLLVAVSPTAVHVLHTSLDTPEGPGSFAGLARFDRAHLEVRFHRRIGRRILELEDAQSGERLALENSKHTRDANTEAVVGALTD